MATSRRDLTCPWCKETLSHSEVKLDMPKNDFGGLEERSCGKCGHIIAAYFVPEGSFLPKIRAF